VRVHDVLLWRMTHGPSPFRVRTLLASAALVPKSSSKRRGSTARGGVDNRRSACLSTLTFYNEELLETTIENIFHTGSYSGW